MKDVDVDFESLDSARVSATSARSCGGHRLGLKAACRPKQNSVNASRFSDFVQWYTVMLRDRRYCVILKICPN